MRKDTAPMMATIPVQRAKTRVRSVTSPAAMRNAANPIAATMNGPAAPVVTAFATVGLTFRAVRTRSGHRDEGHGHRSDADQSTRESDAG